MWQQRSCTKNNNKKPVLLFYLSEQAAGRGRPLHSAAHCNLPVVLDKFINGAKAQMTYVDCACWIRGTCHRYSTTDRPSSGCTESQKLNYIKIQSVPRSKHFVSVIETSQLMLYTEIIAGCSEIHTKFGFQKQMSFFVHNQTIP
jgi:hypothetical protein